MAAVRKANFVGVLNFGVAQVITGLQVQPGLRITPEITRQSHGGIHGDPASLLDDFVQARGRYTQLDRQRVDADAQRDSPSKLFPLGGMSVIGG